MLLMSFTECSFLQQVLPSYRIQQAEKQTSECSNPSRPIIFELIICLANDIATLFEAVMRFLEILVINANISI